MQIASKKICVFALAGSLSAMPLYALAQTAPTNILLPRSNDVPETDDNLDGVEDVVDDGGTQPQVIFADPIVNSNNSGNGLRRNDDDIRNDDPLNGDSVVQPIDGSPAQQDGTQNRNAFGRDIQNTDDNELELEGNRRARRADPVGIIGADGNITPLANSRVVPEQGGFVAPEDNPYAALGIRLGTFILSPVVTQTLGVTSNADFATDGASSAFSQTDARLTVVSDWALHELRGEIGGSYQTFFNGTSEDLPAFDTNMQLRFDHTRTLTTTIGATYALTTESAESDNLTVPPPISVIERPNVYRYGGFAEIAKQTGRLTTSLRGTITRSVFEGAALSNGSTLSQGDRTNTLYQLRGRVGYETSPALQPFVEATIGSRRYQYAVDRNGNRRDSMTYALRGGLVFNGGEKLNGEIALGYSTEQFEDSAIDNLNGVTVDATVNWSPRQFTTLSATAQTSFTGSTNANEAGSVTYAGSIGIVHDVRLNLSLNARVLASIRDYDGSGRRDNTIQASAGAEWRLNRNTAIIGSVGYETVESTDIGSSYDAVTGRIGLRLQH